MEKELFISTLKGKAEVDNLSERTIEEIATMFLPQFTDDTKVTDESWKLPVQMLKTMSGQLRHDTSEGINAFKTKYESDNKNAQQKAIDDAIAKAKAEWEKNNGEKEPDDNNGKDEGIEQVLAKAFENYNKKLFGEDGKGGVIGSQLNTTAEFIKTQTEAQEKAMLGNLGTDLKNFLKEENATKEFAINLAVKNVLSTIDDIKTVDADKMKLVVKKEYESVYKEAYGDGGKPFGGNSAGGEDGSSVASIQEWAKTRQKELDAEAAAAAELEKHFRK